MRNVTDQVRKFLFLNNEIKSGRVFLWKLFAEIERRCWRQRNQFGNRPPGEPPTQAAVVAGTWQIRKIEPGARRREWIFRDGLGKRPFCAHTHTRTHANSALRERLLVNCRRGNKFQFTAGPREKERVHIAAAYTARGVKILPI